MVSDSGHRLSVESPVSRQEIYGTTHGNRPHPRCRMVDRIALFNPDIRNRLSSRTFVPTQSTRADRIGDGHRHDNDRPNRAIENLYVRRICRYASLRIIRPLRPLAATTPERSRRLQIIMQRNSYLCSDFHSHDDRSGPYSRIQVEPTSETAPCLRNSIHCCIPNCDWQ